MSAAGDRRPPIPTSRGTQEETRVSIDPKDPKGTSSPDPSLPDPPSSSSSPSSSRADRSSADELLDLGLRALFDDERQRARERGDSDPSSRGAASSSSSKRPLRAEGDTSKPSRSSEGGIPESIGRFRILGEIARGGVGIVLHGRDDSI